MGPSCCRVAEKLRLGAGQRQPERLGMCLWNVSSRGLGSAGAVLQWGLSSVPPGWAARTGLLALGFTARVGAVAARLKMPIGTFCRSG